MTWILFSLLAPVFFSITSILDKYTVDKVSKGVYDFLFYTSLIELFFSLVIYFFFDVHFSIFSLLAVLAGVILVFAIFFYIKSLEKSDVSLVIPLFNTMPIFLLLISYFVFGKTISGMQFFSFFVVLIGAIIISTEFNFIKKFTLNKTFYLMLMTSFLYAVLFSISDFVIEKTNIATVAFFEGIGFFLGCLFFLFFKKPKEEIVLGLKDFGYKKNFLFSLNNIFDKLGRITVYKAFYLAQTPAFVSVILGIQPFIVLFLTIILGKFLPKIIKENFDKKAFIQKSIGMVIIFIGIYLLYLY